MKKFLPYENLSQREVPSGLDDRIIGYARKSQWQKRFRRQLAWWSSAAAILFVTAAAGICWQAGEKRSGEHMELLAMGDFSKLDQSSYNISLELASNSDFSQY